MVFLGFLQEAQGAIHESRALKSRVHLAEAAQHEARHIEIDYEEVVHLLEAEVERLQRRSNRTPPEVEYFSLLFSESND